MKNAIKYNILNQETQRRDSSLALWDSHGDLKEGFLSRSTMTEPLRSASRSWLGEKGEHEVNFCIEASGGGALWVILRRIE